MRDHVDRLLVRLGPSWCHGQRLIGPLVVAGDADWLECRDEGLLDGRVSAVERRLIAPGFEYDEVAGAADLLEEPDPDETGERASRVTRLAERAGGDGRRGRPRLDVGDGVAGRIDWCVGLGLKAQSRRQPCTQKKQPDLHVRLPCVDVGVAIEFPLDLHDIAVNCCCDVAIASAW